MHTERRVDRDQLRAAAAQVPAERILAETDSPYLAPQARRGRPNEPANVVLTVAELAKARGEDADELGARIAANATAAFSLPPIEAPVGRRPDCFSGVCASVWADADLACVACGDADFACVADLDWGC